MANEVSAIEQRINANRQAISKAKAEYANAKELFRLHKSQANADLKTKKFALKALKKESKLQWKKDNEECKGKYNEMKAIDKEVANILKSEKALKKTYDEIARREERLRAEAEERKSYGKPAYEPLSGATVQPSGGWAVEPQAPQVHPSGGRGVEPKAPQMAAIEVPRSQLSPLPPAPPTAVRPTATSSPKPAAAAPTIAKSPAAAVPKTSTPEATSEKNPSPWPTPNRE